MSEPTDYKASCRRALQILKDVWDADQVMIRDIRESEPDYQHDARWGARMEDVQEEIERLKAELNQPSGVIIYKSEKHHVSSDGPQITARALAEWIGTLPEEFQKAAFMANVGSVPCTLKRVVAFRDKYDSTFFGVVANPMGSHLPMDDSLTWEKVLTTP